VVGRTGRGDTTFAGYLARRLDEGPAEALRFAAALVSIKIETPGPFQGTLSDVLSRMNERP
jgi:sugar/nucleoside kinase (ribokinase family)